MSITMQYMYYTTFPKIHYPPPELTYLTISAPPLKKVEQELTYNP